MIHALSFAGRARLDDLLDRRPLLAFDIDGTLAPLVDRREEVRLPGRVQQLLAAIAERAVVAVVTGRAVDDARRMLRFEPRYLVGNHGAEGLPGSEAQRAALAAVVRGWSLALAAGEPLPRGVEIEDKQLSLSLHYRRARDREAAAASIEQRIRALAPAPQVIRGKAVVNLLPAGAPDKGAAMEVLLAAAAARAALYVGDDVTDEAVFARALPGVLSVRVGMLRTSAAGLYLRDQREIDALLAHVAGRLGVIAARPSERRP